MAQQMLLMHYGPSGFGKTMPIFVGFFASTHLKYVLQQHHFETAQNISKLYFRKWLVIFEFFVNKLIRKLLRIRYVPTHTYIVRMNAHLPFL